MFYKNFKGSVSFYRRSWRSTIEAIEVVVRGTIGSAVRVSVYYLDFDGNHRRPRNPSAVLPFLSGENWGRRGAPCSSDPWLERSSINSSFRRWIQLCPLLCRRYTRKPKFQKHRGKWSFSSREKKNLIRIVFSFIVHRFSQACTWSLYLSSCKRVSKENQYKSRLLGSS